MTRWCRRNSDRDINRKKKSYSNVEVDDDNDNNNNTDDDDNNNTTNTTYYTRIHLKYITEDT